MTRALDSAAPIPAQAAADAGYVGVFRYLYNVTRQEIDAYHAAGLWVALIGEHDTRTHHPIHDGYQVGSQHGYGDATIARNLGAPGGSVIFATADDKVFAGNDELVMDAYCDGYAVVKGSFFVPGLYGGAGPVKFALDGGHTDVGWVAAASYWHNGVDPAAAGAVAHQLLEQVSIAGVTCDVNEIYNEGAWGQWFPPAQPQPEPPKDEETMTPELQQALDSMESRLNAKIDQAVADVAGGGLLAAVNGARIAHREIDELSRKMNLGPLEPFHVNDELVADLAAPVPKPEEVSDAPT